MSQVINANSRFPVPEQKAAAGTNARMKAIRLHAFGGPEVLHYEDAPIPELKPGELIVRVHAVGFNPPDAYLREGYKMLPPEWQPQVSFPVIPGTDISGVVHAVADDVKEFAVGDEVYSMVRFPYGLFGDSKAYAEFVNVPVSEVALKPAGIDHVHAAGAPMSLLTAWQFMIDLGHDEPNPLQPNRHEPVPLKGRTVLINGAAGGVGHFALQIAKWQGARVIAVASGKHAAFLRELGADEFIDYKKTAPEDVVRDVDLVIDSIGGPAASRFLLTVRPRSSASLSLQHRCDPVERSSPRSLVCSTQERFASPSTAPFRWNTLGRPTNAPSVGISKGRS